MSVQLLILVFTELGGETLLGKAREIADMRGDRVLAVCKAESNAEKLIFMGADQVQRAEVEEPEQWVSIVSDLIADKTARINTVLFPFNIVASVIAGAVYARQKKLIGSFMDGVDQFDGETMAKALGLVDFAVQKTATEEQKNETNMVTIDARSIAPVFEDTSRFGKVSEDLLRAKTPISFSLEGVPEIQLNSKNEMSVIVGDDRFRESARIISEKYHAKFVEYSSEIEVVYGPCFALEVCEKLRYLPKFEGDLISLNSRQSGINTISDVSVISPDVDIIIGFLVR